VESKLERIGCFSYHSRKGLGVTGRILKEKSRKNSFVFIGKEGEIDPAYINENLGHF